MKRTNRTSFRGLVRAVDSYTLWAFNAPAELARVRR
jgi:hypothetical protein